MFKKCIERFTALRDYYKNRCLCRCYKEAKVHIFKGKEQKKRQTSNRTLVYKTTSIHNMRGVYIARSLPQLWKDTITYLLIISYFYEEKYKID